MDTLLKALEDLHIKGNVLEENEFASFKKQILSEVREEELFVLKELRAHHINTLKHNVMVAHDTEYIASSLGLAKETVLSLKIAALFHDIGKLDIHDAILNLGDFSEMKNIWQHSHKNSQVPQKLIENITVEEVINYKASLSSDPAIYSAEFKSWLLKKGLSRFLSSSVREYLNHHQTATRRILEQNGFSEEIINFAASHHPNYFGGARVIPRECRIIEIADKFNALIQSEGLRTYMSRKFRTEALEIIINELKQEYGGAVGSLEMVSLEVLARKYLPPEVRSEIIPGAKSIIDALRQKLREARVSANDVVVGKARKMMALIVTTLTLSKELNHLLDSGLEISLEHYEHELEDVLAKAA